MKLYKTKIRLDENDKILAEITEEIKAPLNMVSMGNRLWNFRPMAIHIGKIIEKLVKEKGMSVTSFAEEINTTRRNAYKIFEKDVIDTDLLLKIGKVLGKNLFFYFISDEEIIQYRNRKIKGVVLEDIFIDIKNGINRIENKLENKSTQFKTTARHSGKK